MRGGTFSARYYQETAVDRVLEAVAAEKPRILQARSGPKTLVREPLQLRDSKCVFWE